MSAKEKLKELLYFLAPKGEWFGLGLAVAGTFEQFLKNGEPLWSSVYEFPILHHVWTGFLMFVISRLIREWKKEREQ